MSRSKDFSVFLRGSSVLLAAVALFFAGCGSDDEEPLQCTAADIEAYSPCGGDLVGSWVLQSMCFTGEFGENPDCPEMRMSMDIDFHDLAMTFDGETAIFSGGKQTGSVETRFPKSCMTSDPAVACSDFSLAEAGQTCSGGDTCTCRTPFEDEAEEELHTYVVSGNTIVFTSEDGSSWEATYCVRGDTLELLDVSEDEDELVSLGIFKRR